MSSFIVVVVVAVGCKVQKPTKLRDASCKDTCGVIRIAQFSWESHKNKQLQNNNYGALRCQRYAKCFVAARDLSLLGMLLFSVFLLRCSDSSWLIHYWTHSLILLPYNISFHRVL